MRVRNGTDPGSSPLTRGKRAALDLLDCLQGLIPAHAGKTTPSVWPPLPAWAHPRSRGENGLQHAEVTLQEGSSPLTRGKRQGTTYNLPNYGLIPAHAGKTHVELIDLEAGEAHPRSRGENSVPMPVAVRCRGSSPLTRGKRGRGAAWAGRHGLIPAHAGKTHPTQHQRRTVWAHPRSRGENLTGAEDQLVSLGSSPLTRGKLAFQSVPCGECGLIPAHAGKTRRICGTATPKWAHPRSRGENATSGSSWGLGVGSSPLTRGKLDQRRPTQGLGGLIPAHAGKTRSAV